jgi:hypothetical protein
MYQGKTDSAATSGRRMSIPQIVEKVRNPKRHRFLARAFRRICSAPAWAGAGLAQGMACGRAAARDCAGDPRRAQHPGRRPMAGPGRRVPGPGPLGSSLADLCHPVLSPSFRRSPSRRAFLHTRSMGLSPSPTPAAAAYALIGLAITKPPGATGYCDRGHRAAYRLCLMDRLPHGGPRPPRAVLPAWPPVHQAPDSAARS